MQSTRQLVRSLASARSLLESCRQKHVLRARPLTAHVSSFRRSFATLPENIEPSLMIQFTCNNCQHRQQKTFSKRSYEKGVVILECDGCKKHHLIADNLNWFQQPGRNVEELLQAKGEQVRRVGNVLEVNPPKDNDDS